MVGQDTWGTLVRRNRLRLELSQERLAQKVGVSLKTINRHEKQGVKPDTYELAEALIRVLGIDPEIGFRAAGYGPRQTEPDPDPYAWVRAMGLDPNGRVVRRILHMNGISEDLRLRALRRERELQLRDEQRRLDDLEWTIEQQREQEAG